MIRVFCIDSRLIFFYLFLSAFICGDSILADR